MNRRVFDGDEGSILPLAIFYGVLALVVVLLVTAASSLYLERKRLFTVADGAALAGAEAYDLDTITTSPDTVDPHLESADVASAVDDYLAAENGPDFDALRVDRAESTDGRSATVELSARWSPPIVSPFVPGGIRIDVTSTARSVFR